MGSYVRVCYPSPRALLVQHKERSRKRAVVGSSFAMLFSCGMARATGGGTPPMFMTTSRE